MEVRIWRGGLEHRIRFAHGETVQPLTVVGPSDHPTGTEVTFKPRPLPLAVPSSISRCWNAARELAFLNPASRWCCVTSATPRPWNTASADGGLTAFVEWLDRGKQPLFRPHRRYQPRAERYPR